MRARKPIIKKYIKKPIVVEAIEFDNNVDEIQAFVGCPLSVDFNGMAEPQELMIPTPHGLAPLCLYDYIIKGPCGKFYPCNPVDFHKRHEEITKKKGKK